MPPSPRSAVVFSFFVVAIALLSIADACFITNCPVGGRKRSGQNELIQATKQCPSCGPAGQGGRCFGPSLCCIPNQGCFVGVAGSSIGDCAGEDSSMVPCRNDAPSCEAVPNGQCVLEGYCCNDRAECKSDFWSCSAANLASSSSSPRHSMHRFRGKSASEDEDEEAEAELLTILASDGGFSRNHGHARTPRRKWTGRRIQVEEAEPADKIY